MNAIRDKRTLKAMAKRGLIIFPVIPWGGNSHQIDYDSSHKRRFEYHGKKYTIDYVSGSIFPFVFPAETVVA